MNSNEIRNQFFEFFRNKNHRIVPSAPVVPYDDPTLLFTNAGMNQFKDVFLGKGTRDYTRAADTQKCIRVSGKHNDLEEVGHDTYHHTFFEMLGNWSFGDYYKKEAIAWAWELLTEVWKLPKERLWATVYRADDEAYEIWKKETDVAESHILRFDEKDNFWEMGETGPCGPSSEIHINLSDNLEDASLVNAGVPECIELWNLVFIQYNKDADGVLRDLPMKHVDTGMGFERMCAVLQNKKSNYDADVFQPLIEEIEKLSGVKYSGDENQIAIRVIADHIRTLTFAISDGAFPSNEGRGYVLRRILRRAARYGRKLDLKEPFLFKLVETLAATMGDVFPEIKTNKENVEKIIRSEEESFNVTLDRGIDLFETIAEKTIKKGKNIIPGDEVFKLYDTFGFPADLTSVMAKEKGLSVDEKRFEELMNEQRERARKSTKNKISKKNLEVSFSSFSEIKETEFIGYEKLESSSSVIVSASDDILVLDKTPFYAEAGGQIGDTGVIEVKGKKINVLDTFSIKNIIVHKYNYPIEVIAGEKVIAKVDSKRRWDIMRNHTATHFLHAALRKVLGEHVQQSGSYVGPDRLRFDFTHHSKLSESVIADIEALINEKLRENIELQHRRNIPFEEAKKMGALMFFGDKYGDKVNVVQFGDFTKEFCGGTHVKNSSQIGLFKIVSESSIASGARRIEAVTGAGVERFILSRLEKQRENEEALAKLAEEKKRLEKELNELKLKEKLGGIDPILQNPEERKGVKIYAGKVNAENMDELKSMADELRNKMKSGVGLLVSENGGKVQIVCVISDDLIKEKKLLAGKLVGEAAKIVGGGGGGRPRMATAGGKDVLKIDELLSKFPEIMAEKI